MSNDYFNFNKILGIWKFFLHVTVYLNTKQSFPICMFVVKYSGKCELNIYFSFLQES